MGSSPRSVADGAFGHGEGGHQPSCETALRYPERAGLDEFGVSSTDERINPEDPTQRAMRAYNAINESAHAETQKGLVERRNRFLHQTMRLYFNSIKGR